MSASPRVSVVLIFLNAEVFIRETIESVFGQTYDCWELLLVDDGSTDGSTAIASEYVEQYPDRVRYLEHAEHQNRGMSASRNLGISSAKGEYIALLDADDIWLPRKLEQQVSILDSQPDVSMVYGKPLYWYSWTKHADDMRRDVLSGLGVRPNTLVRPPDLFKLSYPLGAGASPVLSDILFRTQMMQRTGGFQETFTGIYQLYEDQVFLVKVYLSEAVFVAGESWTKYRQHKNSCVSAVTRSGQYHTVRLQFLNWLTGYLTKQEVKDNEVWKALHKALWPYQHPTLHRLLTKGRNVPKRVRALSLRLAQRTLPSDVRRWLLNNWHGQSAPPVGQVRFGNLRRLTPISYALGFDRGQPIDRYYIESFLAYYADDIQGRVLEIGDDTYTRKFGNSRVATSDVLNITGSDARTTVVADLPYADHIPSDTFDCIILTQTLQYMYDVRAAIQTMHRVLKPGGVLLVTLPGISPISRDAWRDSWCWNFTARSAQLLFEETFRFTDVSVQAHGNVLAATAFLQGLAVAELSYKELDYYDPLYQMLITVKATKPEATQ